MKFVKKCDCRIKQGYVVCGDEVIGLPSPVMYQLARLNYEYQAAQYNKDNRPSMPKKVEPFAPKLTYADRNVYEVGTETPNLDKAIEEALKICEDLDNLHGASEVEKILQGYKELMIWVGNEEFLANGNPGMSLGIPVNWDIFEWEQDDLFDILSFIAENGSKPFNESETKTVCGISVDDIFK